MLLGVRIESQVGDAEVHVQQIARLEELAKEADLDPDDWRLENPRFTDEAIARNSKLADVVAEIEALEREKPGRPPSALLRVQPRRVALPGLRRGGAAGKFRQPPALLLPPLPAGGFGRFLRPPRPRSQVERRRPAAQKITSSPGSTRTMHLPRLAPV